jgi:hypothetical protein
MYVTRKTLDCDGGISDRKVWENSNGNDVGANTTLLVVKVQSSVPGDFFTLVN